MAAVEWAGIWAIEFIRAKCKVIHFGPSTPSDIAMSARNEAHLLLVAQTVRVLGVFFTSNLKSSEQTEIVVARAREGLLMMQQAYS